MPSASEIRAVLLEHLAGGAPVPRGVLLNAVAARSGVPAIQRKLRAQVAHELRALEDEGRLVDGGPLVWLDPPRGAEP